jgi:hypothetical protein
MQIFNIVSVRGNQEWTTRRINIQYHKTVIMITISLLYNPYSDTISWHILYYAAYTGQGQLK